MKLRKILPDKTYAPIGAAIELGVSKKTIYRWIRRGRIEADFIPVYDGGRRYAIPASEIKRLRKYRSMIG